MNNISFNSQICEHQPSLQLFALKFTQNGEDAADLVQDTLLKAIRYEYLYKNGTNIKAWLYTIMKNTFINNYRANNLKKDYIQTTEDLSSYQLIKSASKNGVEDHFIGSDIHNAFKKLNPEYSVPFLRYFEGYKYHEIAIELNIPIGTVKTRIHVARQLLKAGLKMYSEEYKKSNKYKSN